MKNIYLALLSFALLLMVQTANANNSVTTERHNSAKKISRTVAKQTEAANQAYQSHVWFHSIDIFFSGDINANGYYHRLEVEFDADTSLPYQQVFAEFTLLPTYGGERVFYTSSVFELYRDSPDDWLAIDTVLENQFNPDDYLLTVRLFDASTGYLLTEISGFDNANLDYIPLEDYNHDSYLPPPTVEVSAGTTGISVLLALCLVLINRSRQTASGAK
ncbi:choice-of-anchor H family protein [Rheinheimera baltica]|uniref:choice-of-anchor H family protein n=1 Tax=Rheinheimera baltica TaxID=67576 RepID=UPI0003FD9E46|nr:choice-of-anchor H family protein [Rheinheimera baltica]